MAVTAQGSGTMNRRRAEQSRTRCSTWPWRAPSRCTSTRTMVAGDVARASHLPDRAHRRHAPGRLLRPLRRRAAGGRPDQDRGADLERADRLRLASLHARAVGAGTDKAFPWKVLEVRMSDFPTQLLHLPTATTINTGGPLLHRRRPDRAQQLGRRGRGLALGEPGDLRAGDRRELRHRLPDRLRGDDPGRQLRRRHLRRGGVQLVAKGSTAVPVAGIATADITDTPLTPGTYFLAMAIDSATAAVWRHSIGTVGSFTDRRRPGAGHRLRAAQPGRPSRRRPPPTSRRWRSPSGRRSDADLPKEAVTPLFVSTFSRWSGAWDLTRFGSPIQAASLTWPVANTGFYVPIFLPFPYQVRRVFWVNGSSVTSARWTSGSTTPTAPASTRPARRPSRDQRPPVHGARRRPAPARAPTTSRSPHLDDGQPRRPGLDRAHRAPLPPGRAPAAGLGRDPAGGDDRRRGRQRLRPALRDHPQRLGVRLDGRRLDPAYRAAAAGRCAGTDRTQPIDDTLSLADALTFAAAGLRSVADTLALAQTSPRLRPGGHSQRLDRRHARRSPTRSARRASIRDRSRPRSPLADSLSLTPDRRSRATIADTLALADSIAEQAEVFLRPRPTRSPCPTPAASSAASSTRSRWHDSLSSTRRPSLRAVAQTLSDTGRPRRPRSPRQAAFDYAQPLADTLALADEADDRDARPRLAQARSSDTLALADDRAQPAIAQRCGHGRARRSRTRSRPGRRSLTRSRSPKVAVLGSRRSRPATSTSPASG